MSELVAPPCQYELVNEIVEAAIKHKENGTLDVFVQYCPILNEVSIRVFLPGTEYSEKPYPNPMCKFSQYLTGTYESVTTLKAIGSYLKGYQVEVAA